MSLQTYLILVVVAVAGTLGSAESSPWVYSDNAPIPDGTLRITTLGSGSPDVRREQVTPFPLPPSSPPPFTINNNNICNGSTAAAWGLPRGVGGGSGAEGGGQGTSVGIGARWGEGGGE